MSIAPTPLITIAMLPSSNKKAFRFESSLDRTPIEVGSHETIDRLVHKQGTLRTKLETLKTVGDAQLDFDFAKAELVIETLRQIGRRLLIDLLGDNARDQLPKILKMCGAVADLARSQGQLPVFRIVAHDQNDAARLLPFELLPLFGRKPIARIDSLAALDIALDEFPAYSAVVGREDDGLDEPLTYDGSRALPIKLFQNHRLKAVGEEMIYFNSRRDVIIKGPWPGAAGDLSSRILAEHIVDPKLCFASDRTNHVDQIQHFSCHSETLDEIVGPFLTVCCKDGVAFDVQLDDISDVWFDYWQSGLETPCAQPLIFMNSCGSAAMDPKAIISFVNFFRSQNKNRGFIGTHTMIPDALAGTFSKSFYHHLLEYRLSVGEAITRARRDVALKHQNPLGALYVHYGSPDLRIL